MKKSPLKQEGGKFGHRDPGTGWSQKEKLKDPAGHSQAVSEGFKHGLPLIGAATVGRFGGRSILNAIKTGVGVLSGGFFGGRVAGPSIVNFGSKTLGNSAKILKKLQSKLTKVKKQYPSSLPKDWNKGGSKNAFEQLRRTKTALTNTPKQYLNPSKETIDYLLKYSKDFGPIIKKMKK